MTAPTRHAASTHCPADAGQTRNACYAVVL